MKCTEARELRAALGPGDGGALCSDSQQRSDAEDANADEGTERVERQKCSRQKAGAGKKKKHADAAGDGV